MSLTFPTRPGDERGFRGAPTRASHCRCGTQQIIQRPGDTCSRCGKYPKDVIAHTWATRAQIVSLASQRQRKPKR